MTKLIEKLEKISYLELTINVSTIVVILVVGYYLAKFFRRLLQIQLKKTKIDPMVAVFLSKLAFWLVLTFAITTCLSTFGIETTSFTAVLASASFAVGLAFQGTLGNFAAGILLLTFRPFKAGDTVKVAGFEGVVSHLDVLSTALDTLDFRRVYIPNGTVFNSSIENHSFHSVKRLEFSVTLESKRIGIEAARALLLNTLEGLKYEHLDKKPEVILSTLGELVHTWIIRIYAPNESVAKAKEAAQIAIGISLEKIPYLV